MLAMKRNKEYLNKKQLSEVLGIAYQTVIYLNSQNIIPEPTHGASFRKYYHVDEVEKIRKKVERHIKEERGR